MPRQFTQRVTSRITQRDLTQLATSPNPSPTQRFTARPPRRSRAALPRPQQLLLRPNPPVVLPALRPASSVWCSQRALPCLLSERIWQLHDESFRSLMYIFAYVVSPAL